MANPLKGEATLGAHTLVYNFGAFIELEEKTGRTMPTLLQSLQTGLGFGELRDFVWAGLRGNAATDEDVVALIEDQGIEAASVAVYKGVSAFTGSQKAKGKNPTKRAQ